MATKITLPPLNKQQQQMLVAVVIFAGAFGYIYWNYFWSPVSKRIEETAKQIEDVQREITRAETQAARKDRLERELGVLDQEAADAEKRLPKAKDVPAVLDMISRLARSHHVTLSNITPGGAAAKQYFIEVPYALSASGTYHDIGRFFAAIALEERIFNIRDVSYGQTGAGTGKEPTLTVTFSMVSYQYKG